MIGAQAKSGSLTHGDHDVYKLEHSAPGDIPVNTRVRTLRRRREMRRRSNVQKPRPAENLQTPLACCAFQQLLRVAQVALLVEERPDIFGQFCEEFDPDRFLIRTLHLVGRRDFRRLGVHHFLSLYRSIINLDSGFALASNARLEHFQVPVLL
jgi:hypothetical protein